MPEMGLENLDAKLFSLRQDLNDTAIVEIRRYLDNNYIPDIEELNRACLLLEKMIVVSADVNKSIHLYHSALTQAIDLHASYKKLLNEYGSVKGE